jgi:hypothetical protein
MYEKEVAMSTILKILAIAGVAVVAAGASAEARPIHEWNHAAPAHWAHPYHWDHARWYGGGYYGPRYYAAPPPVVYPQPYYGPPSLNFNIPLG